MPSALYYCPSDGPKLRSARDAVDLIGDAGGIGAETIVIPAERLDEDFFRLRTGVAGEMLQKFVTYRKRVAIVGDISAYASASTAFRDCVYEANRGCDVWFAADRDELDRRLATAPE